MVSTASVINETNPDIVILDMIMPRLDGLGVLEQLNGADNSTGPFYMPVCGGTGS